MADAYENDPRGAAIEFRKHLGWYSAEQDNAAEFRARVNKAETASEQTAITEDYFSALMA